MSELYPEGTKVLVIGHRLLVNPCIGVVVTVDHDDLEGCPHQVRCFTGSTYSPELWILKNDLVPIPENISQAQIDALVLLTDTKRTR